MLMNANLKIIFHERNDGERTDAIRVFLDIILGDPTAGERIEPPNDIGEITSGHNTRGLRIRGDKT